MNGSLWVAKSLGGQLEFFPGDGTRPVRRTWFSPGVPWKRTRRTRREEWTSTHPSGRGAKRYGESTCGLGLEMMGLGPLRRSMKRGEIRHITFTTEERHET